MGKPIEMDEKTLEAQLKKFDKFQLRALIEQTKNPYVRLKKPEVNVNKNEVLIGIIGSTWLNHKYANLPFLHRLYDRHFKKEGVDFVIHAGDVTAPFNKTNESLLYEQTPLRVPIYVAENYPKAKFKTYLVAGHSDKDYPIKTICKEYEFDHWDVCEEISRLREDLEYICSKERLTEGDIVIGSDPERQFKIKVLQLKPGARVWGVSYVPQKIVGSYATGVKPNMMVLNGLRTPYYHNFESRNIHVLLTGACCNQTPEQREYYRPANIGAWIVYIKIGKNNVEIQPTIIPAHV